MLSIIGRRLLVGLCVLLATAVAPGAVPAATGAPPTTTFPCTPHCSAATADGETAAAAKTAADGETAAAARATATGVPVTVDALTTPSRLVVANPDGSFTARVNDGPVRYQTAGGRWRDIDTTLVAAADGTVRPAASPEGIVLSGGAPDGVNVGVNVVASLGSGPHQVALGWPGTLPRPVLTGSTATYPGVRPGVDLVIQLTRTGFEENFVAHDAAALATLSGLAQPWRTGDLVPASTTAGGVSLRTAAGEQVAVPPARMWDAGVNPRTGLPRHTAEVALAATPGASGGNGWRSALTLHPSTGALAKGSGWQFPVTVDPGVMSTAYTTWDTYVQKDSVDDKDNSSSSELRIGMEDDDAPAGDVIARTYIHWNTAFLNNATVSKADLYLYNFHSWICSTTYSNWAAYRTSATSSSTRWGSAVSWYTTPAPAVSTLTKGASGCSAGWVTADVAGLMNYAAANHVSTFDMGIKASTETKHDGWKLFYSRDNSDSTRDPYIAVTYNHTPTPPAASAMSTGGKACVTGSGRPGMTTLAGGRPATKVNPVSDVDSGDTETVKFYLAKVGSALPTTPTYQVTGVTAGAYASAVIPSSYTLTEGQAYQWQVKVTDASNATSAGSAICEFVVDNFGPAGAPTVTSTVFQDCTLNPGCTTAGAVGVASPVTFDSHGDTDVAKYTYWWDRTATLKQSVSTTSGAPVTVKISPPFLANSLLSTMRLGGQAELDVAAVDAVGHEGPVYRYSMLIGSAPGAAGIWSLNEAAGVTTFANSVAGGPALTASASGVTAAGTGWGDGGTSVAFDGVNGNATGAAAVDTTGNYTVSVWAKLTSTAADNDAVSQYASTGGTYDTELRLGYVKASNAWCFNAVCTTTAPVLNTWTLLTGVRDAASGATSLYVGGTLAKTATQAAAYPATTVFVAGSGYSATGSARPWHGAVDHIQAWNRLLDPAEVGVLASHLAGRWDLTDATTSDALGQHDLADEGVGTPVTLTDADHLADGGTAAGFDGTDALVASVPVLAGTTTSLSVSAWAYLTDNTQYGVIAGQDGTVASGFKLGESPTQGWLIVMPDSDTAAPTQTRAAVGTPAAMNQWVYVTGVYDAAAAKLSLYVNGVLADSVAITPRTWSATGPFSVGRTRWTGVDWNWFSGDIESVRAYAGALTPDLVHRLYLGENPPSGIS
ncbi:LamG-like jellyroll fold domain-containing protein [Hamadaea tsunoensis]|uniref:LamG-like jellyroll fold domain-containing protein n=1 Tax=Hamadaea tsunoensis TaxID=53368 RepID=UPI000423AAD6|nr:LamG-like jellyroll fold domain-containing protein [Hamadaea tsunoensis]